MYACLCVNGWDSLYVCVVVRVSSCEGVLFANKGDRGSVCNTFVCLYVHASI